MNIYALKFGNNIVPHHHLSLASQGTQNTQTELSFSTRIDLVTISSSLADTGTQTGTTLNERATQTDIGLDPKSTEFDLRIHSVVPDKSPLPQENKEKTSSEQPFSISSPIPVVGHSIATTTATVRKPPDSIRENRLLMDGKAGLSNDKEKLRKTALLNMLVSMDDTTKPLQQPQPVLSSTAAVTSSTATFSGVQSSMQPPDAAPPVSAMLGSGFSKPSNVPLTHTFTAPSALIQPTTRNSTFTSTKHPTTHNLGEERRKKELLERLMSIDDDQRMREQQHEVSGHKSKKEYSWGPTVENLHKGKPVYAKVDPFGGRVTTSGTHRADSSKKNLKSTTHQPSGPSALQSSETLVGGQTSNNDNSNDDYFWEKKVDIQNEKGGDIFSDIMNQTGAFRPEQVDQPGAKVFGVLNGGRSKTMMSSKRNSSNFEVPTTVSEPDDLEELVL